MQFLLFIFLSLFNPSLCFNIKHKDYYKYHPDIHILGNHGHTGNLHSQIVPGVTKFIDVFAYNGMNVRKEILKDYKNSNSVLDLCCGVGISTPFSNKDKYCVGVDISKPMISKANKMWKNKKNFVLDDAETYYNPVKFDIVTIFFSFHEIPQHGRKKILENAFNHATKSVIVMDISPNYDPSQLMLYGEPYIEEYLENINDDLKSFDEHIIIKDRVHLWKYDF